MAICDHKWKPYQQWLGRYVCTKCKVVGYTDGRDYAYLGLRSTHSGEVTPYKCRDKECEKLATSIHGECTLCSDHKDNFKISAAERRFHDAVERQNLENARRMEESFAEMRAAREEIMNAPSSLPDLWEKNADSNKE
jgi:hypothetical protein